jgi:hypothetical protein
VKEEEVEEEEEGGEEAALRDNEREKKLGCIGRLQLLSSHWRGRHPSKYST